MAENADSIIRNAGRIASTPDAAIANLKSGAQLGLGPHLAQLDAATPMVLSPIVPIVTHSPTMFRNVPHFDDILKALFERHAKSITGIDFEYTLESSPTPVGHDGQQLNMPTQSRRSQVQPQVTWNDVYGNLIWNFFGNWIKMIRHPDTQASMSSAIAEGAEATPQLMSSFAMDILFIQFDPTMRPENIIDAYMVTSMWPQMNGMAGFQRTPGEVTMPERSITFHGVLQHNINTKRVARNIAEVIGMHRVNYDNATPIAEQIASRLLNKGVQAEATEALANFNDIG